LQQEIISPEKRGTLTEPLKLTEPHYMFCGTPVEEHWFRVNKDPYVFNTMYVGDSLLRTEYIHTVSLAFITEENKIGLFKIDR